MGTLLSTSKTVNAKLCQRTVGLVKQSVDAFLECPWRLDSDLFGGSLREHTRKQGYERDMIYSS